MMLLSIKVTSHNTNQNSYLHGFAWKTFCQNTENVIKSIICPSSSKNYTLNSGGGCGGLHQRGSEIMTLQSYEFVKHC